MKATVIPTRISSTEVQIDFSFLLFAAMAIKGASPIKLSRGKEGINQARLKKMVPETKSVRVEILSFFAINYNYDFTFYFAILEMINYFDQGSSHCLLVHLREFA